MIYGGRATKIGDIEISGTKCGHCENVGTQYVSVYGKYAHIFWIPIFPNGKKAVSECTQCNRTIEQNEFSPELKQQYESRKEEAKRPIWHWFGLIIVSLLFGMLILIGETAEVDARRDLLNVDVALMTKDPTMETDSISVKLKTMFNIFTNEEIDPSEFKYLNSRSITGFQAFFRSENDRSSNN